MYISVDVFLPSEWSGNYTCDNDNTEVHFVINIIKSSSSIVLEGDMYIGNKQLDMVGSFGSYYKTFAIQSNNVISSHIANRNFTSVELNGKVESSVYIDGAIIFLTNSGKKKCTMELRRQTGKRKSVVITDAYQRIQPYTTTRIYSEIIIVTT